MRAFLAGILLAAACSPGTTAFAQAPELQAQEAIAAIEAKGGRVYKTPDNVVDIVALSGENFTDADLELLQAFPSLRQLDLDGSRVTDAGLEHLMKLPDLQEVSFLRTAVAAEAAAAFKDRHPGVYHVAVSPATRPQRLFYAGTMLLPLGFGLWLMRATMKKREVLAARLYARGIACGLLLVVASGLMIVVSLVQAMGIDFHIADMFG